MASLLRGFATINRAADGQPDGEQPGLTTEAKEQRAIASFERALALIQGHREEEAEAALRALLEEPVVAEGATDQLHRIKFLALKNLGDLLARRPGSVGDALAWYSLATQIVEDDALLWNKLGTLAAESGYVAAARTAFERGLELDPQHPTMPDKLLSLLSQAGDAPAAATLATALLRQNPRHAGAAAVLTAQQRGGSGILAAATGAALLQLPPAEMRPGGEVRPSHRQHLERPRTLEQPTWQQLLHHSLLFMTGNRLVEGAAPAAAGGGPLPERKAVPSLVRFNYKKKPPAGQQQAQVQAQQQGSQQQGVGPEASPAATAVQESLTPAGAPALAEHGQQQEQQQQQQGLATPAPSVSPSPAPAAAQGEDASPAAMAVDQSPAAPAALEATTPAAPSPLSPSATPVGTDVASSPGTAQVQCSPAASPAASPADEEQEQRHPNGRGSSKAEARATRSRAATGKAPLPLVPAAADGDQEQTPDEEALELLCTLGSRLSKPQQAAEQGGAPSPLLSSPAKAGRGAAAASSNDQQAAAAQQEEEEAVKAFIKQLPAQGISRPELAALLLNTLGSASGAAQLSAAAHLQLLQVAHHVEHDELALSAEHCLVLGELFADAAVAATRAPAQPGSTAPAAAVASSSAAPQASRGSTPTAPGMHQSSGLVKRSASTRGRRSDLTLEQLQQSCRLWLSRYRLAVAEVAVSPGEELLRGQARYWWATGRLLESAGDMPAASGAYARCESSLDQLVGLAISLPHCQADASVSQATVKAKQEVLQLHTVLGAAGQSASAGDHAAVVAALTPVLLCCTDKEQQMLQLDEQQWLRGMHMLLSAAAASSSLGVALRCHLRLLNALLPAVPPQLLPLVQGREEVAGSGAAAALHATAEQLMAKREAVGALDAAASFLQQHRAVLSLSAATEGSSGSAEQQQSQQGQRVALHPMERAMFEEVQQQAALAVASCAASLAAAGPAAAESTLNLKVNAKRGATVDAATTLLLLDSLAAGSNPGQADAPGGGAGSIAMLQAVERAQDVAWHLCEALGTVQALMERRGRFVQACMRELQSLLKRLDALGPVPASAFDDDTPDAAELRQQLTGGVQHCLFWLFGLELPGLDKQEEWGGDFHAKGGAEAAARQLTSPQAVADVWPLVEPHLLQDVEHVAKHRAFLQAAAEHFSGLPVEAAARSAAAWRQLAAAEPPHMPCDELDGTYPDAMQRLLELASQAPPFQPSEGQEAGAGAAAADAMAVEGQAEAQAGQEGDEQVPFVAVRRSLYYLLSELQDKERTSVDNLLGEDAEAAVERHVQAAKADLCFNPQRSATWEKLAHEYHGAADDLLDAASKAITHRQWRHDRDFRRRVRLWRRLAYWATAGAWLTATSDDDRTRLLAASGWRLLQDVLRTLPCQDPLASNAAWQEVKSSSAYQEGCRLAEAAFDAAAAALEQQDDMAGWELLVAKARCLRKQQQPPVNWLPLLARACHYASSDDGGVLYPLYTLHASRMRMLLAMPSAARWAGNGASVAVQAKRSGRWREREQQSREQERDLLQLVGSYCFLPASNTSLNSPSQPARRPAAAAAEEELKEDWQGLLEDCCAAMRWCLEKDRNFHRAAYRLADAMQRTGQSHRAVALLEPLFTRGKQVFTANITPILESKVDAAPKRGRKARQLGGGAQEQEQQQADGGEGAAPEPEPECNWGEPPARLTSIGVQEDEATFGTRLRKTLRLYFSCLADAAAAAVDGQALPESQAGRQPPLEVLQQAAAYIFSMPPSASKAWDGCDKLARGHFLLALVACLRTCCPLEQLPGLGPPAPTPRLVPAPDEGASTAVGMEVDASEAQHAQQGQQTPGAALIAAHAAHAAGPLSAAPASAVQATPAEAVGTARSLWPTPATHARHQQSQRLLQVAAGLNGSPAELLLAKAHQVFSDYSMHAEGDDKWKSVAAPAVQEALSNSSSSVVADEEVRQLGSQPEHLRKFFNLYAMLHVHLLQHEGATDKLLTLLLAMKKRVKGISTAEPRHARFLRRQALVLSEALLGAVEGALAKAERDVGAGAALPEQAAPQEPDAPMEVDEQPAEGAVGQAQQEQQEQQRALQGQSPAPASGATEPHGSQLPASPAEQQQQLATQTPAGATAGAAARGITPGTNLRAVLGTPATLPSVEQQQLQERCVALLQVAHSFQRDLSRWLQMMGAAASGSTAAAREEMRALGSISEDVLLRAYRLHVRCTGQPTMAELSRQSRAEQLKAAEEAAKQQRRQSRQQGAAGRQQQQQGGASAAAAGALPPIAEAGEEQPAPPAGRKRGANEAAPPTTRKRLRSASVAPQPQPQQAQEEEAAAAAVHEVAQAVEAAAAAEQAAE